MASSDLRSLLCKGGPLGGAPPAERDVGNLILCSPGCT